jgi:hypothetical protein
MLPKVGRHIEFYETSFLMSTDGILIRIDKLKSGKIFKVTHLSTGIFFNVKLDRPEGGARFGLAGNKDIVRVWDSLLELP